MILKFMCYSETNRDFENIYYSMHRFRGCEVGEPIIVRGSSIENSEYNLRIILEALLMHPNIELLSEKSGSAIIEVKNEKA